MKRSLLLLALLLLAAYAQDSPAREPKQDDDERDDSKSNDREYAAWLNKEIEERLSLLETLFGVSEALSAAEAPLDEYDEEFFNEVLRAHDVQSGADDADSELPDAGTVLVKDKLDKAKLNDDNAMEKLLELAVNMFGSMLSEVERKTNQADDNRSRNRSTQPKLACLENKTEAARCSGDFQRWIVYKTGDFCKLTADGECPGMWHQGNQPVECAEVCIYAPSAEGKKLSIRLGASVAQDSPYARNDTIPSI